MQDLELSLRDYVNIFLRRWWIVALVTILCLLFAALYTSRQTPMYSSSASVAVNQSNASEAFDPTIGSTFAYAERLAENEARFLGSGLVAEAAIERLGYEAYVSVTTDDFADVLTVTAQSDDPFTAQEIAQVYANTYVDERRARFVADRLATASTLVERIAELEIEILDATGDEAIRLQNQRANLAESRDLLDLSVELSDDAGAQVLNKAFLPGSPFAPRPLRNLALAGVLGLIVGSGIALVLESLDRSVKSREVLESLTPGAPNLAVIPSLGKSLDRSDTLVCQSDPTGTTAEAFRTLRAALQYVSVDDTARVIQVASAQSAAGKTTVAANLAITLAQAGQRVVVVDSDLRRPRLHQLFGITQMPGLTSAIIGAMPLENCLRRGTNDDPATSPLVLPSGAIPPGPAELLGSAAAESVIERLGKMVDYVIIDTPPVLPVADTLVLSQYVDASLLVVDASKTTRVDVELAYDRLQQAGAPVIGTVLNKVKRNGPFGYGYGYGYGYGTGYGEDAPSKRGPAGWFNRNDKPSPAQVSIPAAAIATSSIANGAQAAQVAQAAVAPPVASMKIPTPDVAPGIAVPVADVVTSTEDASAWADSVQINQQ